MLGEKNKFADRYDYIQAMNNTIEKSFQTAWRFRRAGALSASRAFGRMAQVIGQKCGERPPE